MPAYYTITYEFEQNEENETLALQWVKDNYTEPSSIEVEVEDEDD